MNLAICARFYAFSTSGTLRSEPACRNRRTRRIESGFPIRFDPEWIQNFVSPSQNAPNPFLFSCLPSLSGDPLGKLLIPLVRHRRYYIVLFYPVLNVSSNFEMLPAVFNTNIPHSPLAQCCVASCCALFCPSARSGSGEALHKNSYITFSSIR